MQAKSWHYSTVSLRTHTHTQSVSFSVARALSLSLPPHLPLSLSFSLSLTHTYARVSSSMLTYAGVCWRMLEWLQFGDVRYDTAVSLYPTIASFNTYGLPYTPIASLISHIGYAAQVSPPSYPISTTSIDEIYETVSFCSSAEPRERGDYLTILTVAYKALRRVSSLILSH